MALLTFACGWCDEDSMHHTASLMEDYDKDAIGLLIVDLLLSGPPGDMSSDARLWTNTEVFIYSRTELQWKTRCGICSYKLD